jgi:hypothetical protein
LTIKASKLVKSPRDWPTLDNLFMGTIGIGLSPATFVDGVAMS